MPHPLIPELPEYSVPEGHDNYRASNNEQSYTKASFCPSGQPQKLKNMACWNIQANTQHGFGSFALHGRYDVPVEQFFKGSANNKRYHWNFAGRYHLAKMGLSNDPNYGGYNLYMIGDFLRAYFKTEFIHMNIPPQNLRYDIDEKEIGAPHNKFTGYFKRIDIELGDGWIKVEYPYIHNVDFWGWPMSPVDTREYNKDLYSLNDLLEYKDWMIENGPIVMHNMHKLWKRHVRPVDYMDVIQHQNIKKMMEDRDKRTSMLKRSEDIVRQSSTSSNDPIKGLMNYTIGGNLPDETRGDSDRYGWDFFLVDGPLFKLEVTDATFMGRLVVFGPITRIRFYPTDPFLVRGEINPPA